MEAVVFDTPGRARVAEIPDPVVGSKDVLVAVRTAGVCGTDVHIYEGDFIADYPLIPGHEFAGEIVDVGATLVSHRFPLDDFTTAMNMMLEKSGSMKIVIEPQP